jgi:hypothetical protein
MEYEKGDPEQSLAHRSNHGKVMKILQPKPHADMLARRRTDPAPELVTLNSPLWMHREMYARALLFKREFGYDSTQWTFPASRAQREREAIGFLFTSEAGLIDGACGFRQREGEWCMDWIWIRPAMRRSGLLAARWPELLNRFGDFWMEHPLSPAMTDFVVKHGTPGQKAKIIARYGNATLAGASAG